MEQKYEQYISCLKKMAGKDDVDETHPSEIIEKYLLPQYVGMVGTTQRKRGYVSDEFMRFLADWGQYNFRVDEFFFCHHRTADSLMLIGMQRIICGAVYSDKKNRRSGLFNMPKPLNRYAGWNDVDMPMNRECWKFLQKNLLFGLQATGQLKEVSTEILKCMLLCLNATNRVSDKAPGYEWSEKKIGVSVRSAYLWALNLGIYVFGVDWCAQVMAPVWHEKMFFFRKYRRDIGWKNAKKYFLLDEENYYSGFTRKVLEDVHLYHPLTMRKIKREIFAA